MQTIPFSTAVNIVPGVLSAGGNAVDLNPVILSQSIYAPLNEVLGFTNATDVSNYFGPTSPEYQAALGVFQGPDNALATAGLVKFLGYPENATPGWLLGDSNEPATLAALQLLSGTLIITVGGTLFTSAVINLNGATSFSAAAALMLAAFTAPTFTIVYDALHQAFLITSAATGAAASITYCTGTLANGVGLDQASGGTLSQGANAATTPNATMNWLTANDQNWATFTTTWQSTLTERQAFASWSASVSPRYLYVPYDEDAADNTANNPSSFGGYLKTTGAAGTLPVYGALSHSALVLSWAASLNFNQENGRSTLCFRSQAGLTPSVSDSVTYANVTSNGYNVYGAFGSNNPANNSNWMTPGSVSGNWKWADTYINQIWLNANLQLAVVNGMKSVGQIPYNSDGDALLAGFCAAPIEAALNFGAIRKGVSLSPSQIQQVINLVGADVSATITAQGYYLFTNAAGTAATVRSARGSPPAILLYQDGESVQSLTMPSIVIQ